MIDRERAEQGALITLHEPTKPMYAEAADAGFYESPGWNKKYQAPDPHHRGTTRRQEHRASAADVTFKKAPKVKEKSGEQLSEEPSRKEQDVDPAPENDGSELSEPGRAPTEVRRLRNGRPSWPR